MMKRLSLLLAALFVAATLFAAPVIASGNGDNNNSDKVCVLRHEDDNGKDYHWVWDVEDLHLGDKVVNDHFCEDDHNGNGNGDHNGNGGDDYHNGNEG
jgi:hypothetical protein